ncbi:MAG: glycosyltransferase, partial [Actinobacteria bacterium]|nr:glycosyltransferase [Actinomycetota bacterium]
AIPTIVFTDGGGMVEHIESGETGFAVADQSELESTLRRLIENRAWGREIGAAGRSSVRAHYTPAHAARAYRALYAKAVGRSPKQRLTRKVLDEARVG